MGAQQQSSLGRLRATSSSTHLFVEAECWDALIDGLRGLPRTIGAQWTIHRIVGSGEKIKEAKARIGFEGNITIYLEARQP
jgi:hypothetical protein